MHWICVSLSLCKVTNFRGFFSQKMWVSGLSLANRNCRNASAAASHLCWDVHNHQQQNCAKVRKGRCCHVKSGLWVEAPTPRCTLQVPELSVLDQFRQNPSLVSSWVDLVLLDITDGKSRQWVCLCLCSLVCLVRTTYLSKGWVQWHNQASVQTACSLTHRCLYLPRRRRRAPAVHQPQVGVRQHLKNNVICLVSVVWVLWAQTLWFVFVYFKNS